MSVSRRRFLTLTGAGLVAAAVDAGGLISPVLLDTAAADTAGPTTAPARGLFGGLTTLDQTVVRPAPGGNGGYVLLEQGAGEGHGLNTSMGALYSHPKYSLGAFAQMTDLHIVDDQSPGRVEFTDRLADLPNLKGYPTSSAYRPNEFLSTHIVEAMCRAIVNVGSGPITGLPLAFTIVTGDLVDNVQANETRWCIDLLDGGHFIQPDSGQLGLEQSVSYHFGGFGTTGLHDPAYWFPEGPADPANGVTDNYQKTYGFPNIPGLLAAARTSYASTGLGMPWYAAMGNHDGELQGNYPVHPGTLSSVCEAVDDITGITTGSQKPYTSAFVLSFPPNPSIDDANDLITNFTFLPVVADSSRANLSQEQFAIEHWNTTGLPAGHGFGEDGTTHYVIPAAGPNDLIRYITIDTVNYDGNAGGRLSEDQFDWLESQIRAVSSSYLDTSGNTIANPGVTDKLCVIFCHHTIDTIDNSSGVVESSNWVFKQQLESMLLRYANVILMVNGHTHQNGITSHPRGATSPQGNNIAGVGGFWEINTASHIDFPSQCRIVEIAAGQEALSIITTIVDMAAPLGYGGDLTSPTSLASLGRELAANDPTERNSTRPGKITDRNMMLFLPIPPAFQKPSAPLAAVPTDWGSSIALVSNGAELLELFGATPSGTIFHAAQSAQGSWAGAQWQQMDGLLEAVAGASVPTNGFVELFGVNVNDTPWHRRQTNIGDWTGSSWTAFDGLLTSMAAAANRNGVIEVFGCNSTGGVFRRTESSLGNWSGTSWVSMLGGMVKIAAAADGRAQIWLFAIDAAGQLWQTQDSASGAFPPWSPLLPGRVQTSVTVSRNFDGTLAVFTTDHDWRVGSMMQTAVGSTQFSPWTQIGGRMTQLAAALNGIDQIDLFGVDNNGLIWHRLQASANSGIFLDWQPFPGVVLRPDVAVPLPNSTVGTPPPAPNPVFLPSVLGQSQRSATQTLERLGLVVDVEEVFDCVDPGDVAFQSPTGGDNVQVQVGSTVTIGVHQSTQANGKPCVDK